VGLSPRAAVADPKALSHALNASLYVGDEAAWAHHCPANIAPAEFNTFTAANSAFSG